ncbi:MAG: hypothetical protein ACXVLQ_02585 [Bacteriovorax sp.]
MKKKLICIFALIICSFPSFGDIVFHPEKKGHLFQTLGLFTEEGQTALYNRGGSKYWGEIGSKITLFDLDSIWGRPQFVLNAGVQASMRKQGKEFLSDTLDVRVGVAGLFTINSNSRLMVAVSHLSGHVLEDVPDKDLIPINVGDETLQCRYVRDYEKTFRFGGTLKYVFGTEGEIRRVNADQFLEWLPLTERSSLHASTPYIALGLEENGFDKYVLTTHAQTGLYWGNHLDPQHDEIIRVSLGGYSGLDPRQKYSHFKRTKAHFGYLGLAYEY